MKKTHNIKNNLNENKLFILHYIYLCDVRYRVLNVLIFNTGKMVVYIIINYLLKSLVDSIINISLPVYYEQCIYIKIIYVLEKNFFENKILKINTFINYYSNYKT